MAASFSAGSRTRTVAVVVAVAVAALVVPGAATATPSGTQPAADAAPTTVLLMPGTTDLWSALITDDAIIAVSQHPAGAIYRRSMTSDASGTVLGPATFIDRTRYDSDVAEYDGTLAYARAIDGRLVFREADGLQKLPTWGVDPVFSGGVSTLTSHMLTTGQRYSPMRLFSRDTGEEIDLQALSAPPDGVLGWAVDEVTVTDDRALWSACGEDGGARSCRVYTVALDQNGPTGPVTLVDEGGNSWLRGLGIAGDMIVWYHSVWSPDLGDSITTLRWYGGAPYEGEPSELPESLTRRLGPIGRLTGTEAVIETTAGGLTWYDLAAADPATPVRSALVGWDVRAVSGSLVVRSDPIGSSGDHWSSWFIDVDGLPITADPTPAVTPGFTDVPSSEFSGPGFAGEITWLADHGIVGGFADGTYRGLTAVSRGAMAAFLYRTTHDGADAPACTTAPFTDVATTHPFCGEIAWLAEAGITTGWPDGTFRPTQPVSREAMAAFLYRLANDDADAPACTTAPFTDVATTNPFCAEITWLTDTGITTGWPDGTFHPTTAVSRQAMAAFLFRYIDAGLVPTTT